MKHLSVRIALAFFAICLGLILGASMLLFTTYRSAIVDDAHEDLQTVYSETARLLRSQAAGEAGPDDVAVGIDFISRVRACKIYVLRYDADRLEATLPTDLAVQTKDLADDLLLIAQGKMVFRELVYRAGNETPFVFLGGPAPADEGAAAVLVFASASPMFARTTNAARMLLYGAVCLVVLISIIIFFVTDRFLHPLRQMTGRARLLAQGEPVEDIPAPRFHDEIGELTRAFNHMKNRVLENENSRQEFLSSMSHDIRTPLTHIRTSALGLKEGWLPPDMREKAVDIIANESDRLIGMTNDLLEAARLQSGSVELRLSMVDLAVLLRDAVEAASHPDEVSVQCDEALRASIDEGLFRRVLANLLDNAFRYGRSPVEIHADSSGGVYRIRVRDHGDGLPESDLDRIFERFYRAEATASKHKGMGIGLHSARRSLQLHGGDITARNAEGGGLEFTLTWPDTLNAT